MGALVLIPWAQTDWSDQGRLAAQTGLPLNADGVTRATQWGEQLAKRNVPIIFAGDGLTDRQTAETVAHASNARVKSLSGLEEVNLGLWEGLTQDTLKARFPKAYKRWIEDPASVCAPEGEVLADASERIAGAIHRAGRKAGDHPAGVVLGPLACAVARCEFEDADLASVRSLMTDTPVWYEHSFDKKVLGGASGKDAR